MADKILDKDISIHDYLRIRKCKIAEGGKEITFQYANGVAYDVPIDYFLQWFHHPHYLVRGGRAVEWNEKDGAEKVKKNAKFVKWRRMLDGSVVRIYLSDKTVFEVPWDLVLMACERDYEHFGGLTEEFKKIVRKWQKL